MHSRGGSVLSSTSEPRAGSFSGAGKRSGGRTQRATRSRWKSCGAGPPGPAFCSPADIRGAPDAHRPVLLRGSDPAVPRGPFRPSSAASPRVSQTQIKALYCSTPGSPTAPEPEPGRAASASRGRAPHGALKGRSREGREPEPPFRSAAPQPPLAARARGRPGSAQCGRDGAARRWRRCRCCGPRAADSASRIALGEARGGRGAGFARAAGLTRTAGQLALQELAPGGRARAEGAAAARGPQDGHHHRGSRLQGERPRRRGGAGAGGRGAGLRPRCVRRMAWSWEPTRGRPRGWSSLTRTARKYTTSLPTSSEYRRRLCCGGAGNGWDF